MYIHLSTCLQLHKVIFLGDDFFSDKICVYVKLYSVVGVIKLESDNWWMYSNCYLDTNLKRIVNKKNTGTFNISMNY